MEHPMPISALSHTSIIFIVLIILTAEANDIKDFCQFDTFNATCGPNAVVVMEAAQYGRMRFGRCIDRDYGYVGCSSDVLLEVDRRCSGRHSCAISVPDSDLHSKQPCPKDLTAYFEASYRCESVTVGPRRTCGSTPAVLTDERGTLARVTALESGYGSESCPWLIQAKPGQRINITLLDFAISPPERQLGLTPPVDYCRAYAIIRDRQTERSTTVCGGHARKSIVYLSQSNSVEVRVIRAARKDQVDHFLLHYETIGCPQFKAPPHAHVQFEGGRLLVTCNGTGQTWSLHCEGSTWMGKYDNCSQASPWGIQEVIGNFTSLPFELTAVLIASIAFVVIVFVLVMGFVCLRRRHYNQGRPLPRPNPLLVDPYDKNQYNGTMVGVVGTGGGKEYVSTAGMRGGGGSNKHRSFSGEYASIWESQYPMTLHQNHSPMMGGGIGSAEDTFAAPMTGLPDGGGYSTHPALPPQLPPRVEHIYESPKFDRCESSSSRSVSDLPVYFELDPDDNERGGGGGGSSSGANGTGNGSSTMPRPGGEFLHRHDHFRDRRRYSERDG